MLADTPTRLRLVEIRTGGATLRMEGGLACVVTPPGECTNVAAFISALVIGPRPPHADATIEIAGRFVSARRLPSPLLAPSAPAVVDAARLRQVWRAVCTRRRDELAARHATLRVARHRAAAALDRAQARVAFAARPLEAGVDPAGLVAAEKRVRRARVALAALPGAALTKRVRAELEARHRAVGEAEAAIASARRRERAAAAARYEAAVRAEHEALAAAGVASYASMLVELARGTVDAGDPAARDTAIRELAEAEAALHALRVAHPDADALARAHARHSAELDAIDRELTRLDAARGADPVGLDAGDLELVCTSLLDAYRRSELLAGRLPMVFAGSLDGISPEAGVRLARFFAATSDVQVILVTADPSIADAVRGSGGEVLTWPEGLAADAEHAHPPRPASRSSAPREADSSERTHCGLHPEARAVAHCAQCHRAGCGECLVYVIGEPDLWCSACACRGDDAGANAGRVVRRRGA